LLAGYAQATPLVVRPDANHPDGAVFVASFPNLWSGEVGVYEATRARYYELDARTGQVLAEYFYGLSQSQGFTAKVGSDGSFLSSSARIYTSNQDGAVFALNPVVVAPSQTTTPLLESPTLAVVWSAAAAGSPTAPNIDVQTATPVVYVGDIGGEHAFNATTGSLVYDLAIGAAGSDPALVMSSVSGGTPDDVGFGAANPVENFQEVNGATGSALAPPLNTMPDGLVTGTAVTHVPYHYVIGSDKGNVFVIG
jgi:outer membrane protein assembly factor BamB